MKFAINVLNKEADYTQLFAIWDEDTHKLDII